MNANVTTIVEFLNAFPSAKVEVTAAALKEFAADIIAESRHDLEVEREKIKLEPTDALLDPDVVKMRLGISSTTLWRWRKKKLLVPVSVGGITKYRQSDVDRLMA